MQRLPYCCRRRIANLRSIGFKTTEIKNDLNREGYSVSLDAIRNVLRNFRKRKHLSDAHRSGRPQKYPHAVSDLIDRAMLSNNELTAASFSV